MTLATSDSIPPLTPSVARLRTTAFSAIPSSRAATSENIIYLLAIEFAPQATFHHWTWNRGDTQRTYVKGIIPYRLPYYGVSSLTGRRTMSVFRISEADLYIQHNDPVQQQRKSVSPPTFAPPRMPAGTNPGTAAPSIPRAVTYATLGIR
jgi:hypothetical protein